MSITWVHRAIRQKTVSPADCALLVGIPLEESAFYAKYNGPRDGNFAQSVAVGDPESAWAGYGTLTDSLVRSIEEVEALGVHVYRSLTEQALADAMQYEVVTIATQWRSAEFMPSDVVDVASLGRELGLAGQPVDVLVARLNLLLRGKIESEGHGVGASTRRQTELIRCRAEMEALYQSQLRGGAGVEFSDGFRAVGEVAGIFPPSFEGIVDLTVCNSLALAETIRMRCSGALALAMGDVTRPHLRFPLYVAIMRLLERRPEEYDVAVQRIFSWLERRQH